MQKKLKKTAVAAGVAAMLGSTPSAHALITYNLEAETGGAYCSNFGGACPANGTAAGPWTNGNPGYSGNLPATWIAVIENAGGVAASETASSAGAGFSIDMGSRAYKDGSTNWGHTTDFGLFQLQHDAWVTIQVSSDNSVLRPAFGLWKGWATTGNRHQSYLNNGALNPMANGVFTTGSSLQVVDANAWAAAAGQGSVGNDVTATLTRYLTAGNYTLILGGYDTSVGNAFAAYKATISAAAVPLPAAAWLFGPVVAGLCAVGRRRPKAVV